MLYFTKITNCSVETLMWDLRHEKKCSKPWVSICTFTNFKLCWLQNTHRVIGIPLKEFEIRVIQVLSAVLAFGGWRLKKQSMLSVLWVTSLPKHWTKLTNLYLSSRNWLSNRTLWFLWGRTVKRANLEMKIVKLSENTVMFVVFQDRRPTLHQVQPWDASPHDTTRNWSWKKWRTVQILRHAQLLQCAHDTCKIFTSSASSSFLTSVCPFVASPFTSSDLRFWLQEEGFHLDMQVIKVNKCHKIRNHLTHTFENMDIMVGCFPLFLVTLELAGDSEAQRRQALCQQLNGDFCPHKSYD